MIKYITWDTEMYPNLFIKRKIIHYTDGSKKISYHGPGFWNK